MTGIPVLQKQCKTYAKNCGNDKSSVRTPRGTESLEILFLKGNVVETGKSFTGKWRCCPDTVSCLEEEIISKQTPRDHHTKEQTNQTKPKKRTPFHRSTEIKAERA